LVDCGRLISFTPVQGWAFDLGDLDAEASGRTGRAGRDDRQRDRVVVGQAHVNVNWFQKQIEAFSINVVNSSKLKLIFGLDYCTAKKCFNSVTLEDEIVSNKKLQITLNCNNKASKNVKMYNFLQSQFKANELAKCVLSFNRKPELQYSLCCPLLDPQIAGTGELPPETMNWKQKNHFLLFYKANLFDCKNN